MGECRRNLFIHLRAALESMQQFSMGGQKLNFVSNKSKAERERE